MTPTLTWNPYPKPSDPVLFDVRGARRTGSLFHETTKDTNRTPVFTLKEYSVKGYPSAYELYMDAIDEYDAATMLVGSIGHWRLLTNKPWFMNGDPEVGFSGLLQWRADMAARDARTAKKVLLDLARDGDRAAAVKLLDYSTKGDIAGAAKERKTKKDATRRGTQKQNGVVDITQAI